MKKNSTKLFLIVPYVFSIYYLITGIWPILDIHSFMVVTGPKTDIWLVKTVGTILFVIGATVLLSAIRKSTNLEIVALSIGAGIGLSIIDLYYVFNNVISPVYLFDAIVEFILILLWIAFIKKNSISL